MNKLQMKIVGEIIALAKDKRSHVLYEDCYRWELVKMRAIRRLAKMLPHTPAKTNKYGEILNSVIAGKVSSKYEELGSEK